MKNLYGHFFGLILITVVVTYIGYNASNSHKISSVDGTESAESPAMAFNNPIENAFQDQSETGSKVTSQEAKEFLEHHNMSRNELGIEENLSWSKELATVAQKYAEKLASSGCDLVHSQGSPYGENLFWGMGRVFTALDGSKSWYEEKADTPYDNSTYNHYTQMIWKNTTQVGAGVAKCPNGSYIVVANYNPPGNYTGQYPY